MVLCTGRPYRRAVAVAVVFAVTAGMLLGVGLSPAVADVTMVTGSAFGCYANTTFSMAEDPGPATETGPLPEVTLPPEGGSDTATEPECVHRAFDGGPTIISTGPLAVSTEGTTGADGSVTSTATLGPVNTNGNENFTAESVSSECTADETEVSGSTTVTDGVVHEADHPDADAQGDLVVPESPEPGYTVLVDLGFASYNFIFNEQITNPDGSITVNAVRMEPLTGPLQGTAILGQVVCGATADTTTTTTTTTVPGTTTTSVPGTTTTTPPPTTTVPPATPVTTIPPTTSTTTPGEDGAADDAPAGAGVTEVGGGAFGYFTDVSLFGGPSEARGPEPTVTLAADASNSPQDASIASAEAVYGPAVLFRSGQIDVRTEGALGAEGYVTSSSSVQGAPDVEQRPGPLLYDALESTCTVDGDSVVGTTTVTGGVVETRTDPNTQLPVDTEAVPANPAPGYTVEGTIDHVGDSFRIVFNEQITHADGSITVNAAHMHLLGPIAVGELIIGQSECAWGTAAAGNTGDAAGGGAGGSGTGRGAGTGTGTDGRLARSGSDPLPAAALGFGLLLAGMFALQGGRRGRVVDGRVR